MASDPTKVEAAIKLQSLHRQKAAKKTATFKRDPAMQASALKLQAVHRGHKGRQASRRKKKEKQVENTLVIQVSS